MGIDDHLPPFVRKYPAGSGLIIAAVGAAIYDVATAPNLAMGASINIMVFWIGWRMGKWQKDREGD